MTTALPSYTTSRDVTQNPPGVSICQSWLVACRRFVGHRD